MTAPLTTSQKYWNQYAAQVRLQIKYNTLLELPRTIAGQAQQYCASIRESAEFSGMMYAELFVYHGTDMQWRSAHGVTWWRRMDAHGVQGWWRSVACSELTSNVRHAATEAWRMLEQYEHQHQRAAMVVALAEQQDRQGNYDSAVRLRLQQAKLAGKRPQCGYF